MSRWTGSWLAGSGANIGSDGAPGGGSGGRSGVKAGDQAGDEQQWRGQRLGLPADGPGSVAGFGRRLGGIFVDWLPCAVAAQLFTTNPGLSALTLFALLTVVSLALFGRTPGHAAAGIRAAMLDGSRLGPGTAIVRTVLLCLAVPPLIMNADGRGLHDRATGTVVLRTR